MVRGSIVDYNRGSIVDYNLQSKIIINYLSAYKTSLSFALCLNLVSTLSLNLQCIISKETVNLLSAQERLDDFFYQLTYMFFLLLLLTFGSRLAHIASDKILITLVVPQLTRDVKLDLSKKLFNKNTAFYTNTFCGSLISKVEEVSQGISNIIPVILECGIGSIFLLLMSIVTVSQVGIKYALLVCVWAISFIMISYISSLKSIKLSYLASEVRAKLTGKLADVFSNIQVVKLFTNQVMEYNSIKKVMGDSVSSDINRDSHTLYISFLTTIFFLMLNGFSLMLLAFDFKNGIVTPGDFSLVLGVNFILFNTLSGISKEFFRFFEAIGNIKHGLTNIFPQSEESDKINQKTLIVNDGKIEFKQICFKYPDSPMHFNKLSLTIEPKMRVGLIGKSGAGKTTLLNLLLKKYLLDAGTIEIDKQNIAEIPHDDLYRMISVIPQDISLFHRSIFDNILYGNPKASADDVYKAAMYANIHKEITGFKYGYDTLVGERGVRISGGQRQRVALARAFLKNAPILLLDEATSHVDSLSEKLIQESLDLYMHNRTSIIITHKLSTAIKLDKIVVIDNGGIIEMGNHKELLAMRGFYAKIWENSDGSNINLDQRGPFKTEGKDELLA